MARIRSIKPCFWERDECAKVSIQSLLLYIAMKNFSDDRGIIPANEKIIKSKVFPQRDDIRVEQISRWLTELRENSFLVQFEYDTKLYYALDFSEERIDKPQPSILPDDALNSKSIPVPLQEHSCTTPRVVANIPAGEERKGKERNRKGIGEGRFKPPEIIEVINFFSEKGYSEALAKKAFEYYDSATWVDSKGNQVLNWKQKMISVWLKPENKEKSSAKKEKLTDEQLSEKYAPRKSV